MLFPSDYLYFTDSGPFGQTNLENPTVAAASFMTLPG